MRFAHCEFPTRVGVAHHLLPTTQQTKNSPSREITIGDTVHYSKAFCKSTSMHTYNEAVGQDAKIIGINGKVAHLRWNDNSETSALLSNLEKIEIPESTYSPEVESLLRQQRLLLLLDAAISVNESWATTKK